jgi:hypothetical protein
MDTAGQLDLFADGRDTMLRGDLALALVAGDRGAAVAALAMLDREFGDDGCIAPGRLLLDDLDAQAQVLARPVDRDGVLARARALDGAVAAAAQRVLGEAAAAPWLCECWAVLAWRARLLRWDREHPMAHAAPCWLRAERWAEAEAAATGIESWRRIPQPLLWALEARWHHAGPDAAWPLLAEACWLAPGRAQALLSRLRDGRSGNPLARLARGFDRAIDALAVECDANPPDALETAWAWFPAWTLVEQPLLLPLLDTTEPAPGRRAAQAFELVRAALRLERGGRHAELVSARRALKEAAPGLFGLYMSTR